MSHGRNSISSYDSFMWIAWPIGTNGEKLPSCAGTPFKLSFDKSMKSHHSSALWLWPRSIIRWLTLLQKQRSPLREKLCDKSFSWFQNTGIFMSLSSKFQPCSPDHSSSTWLFYKFKFQTRSFSFSRVIKWGYIDKDEDSYSIHLSLASLLSYFLTEPQSLALPLCM
jgi:hypothetical protein